MNSDSETSSNPPIIWHGKRLLSADQKADLVQSVLGLAESGIPVNVWPALTAGAPADENDGQVQDRMASLEAGPPSGGGYLSVIHAEPSDLERDSDAKYCIGRTAVGTLRVPESWAAAAGDLDEIWVPSGFSRMALAASGVREDKIKVVPSCIDSDTFKPSVESLPVDRNEGFVFATALDWDYTRGLDIVLEAYVKEFKRYEEVTLVLKAPEPQRTATVYTEGAGTESFWSDLECWLLGSLRDRENCSIIDKQYEELVSTLGADGLAEEFRRERNCEKRTAEEIIQAVKTEMKKGGENLPDIKVVNRTLPGCLIPRFYSACDAFVMAPRAELWGRSFLESMAVGLPTIGTKWGGHLDFMRPDNSFLIRVRSLINIDDEDKLGWGGQRLAKPDVQHLRDLMRRVFEHRSEAKERAARGSDHIRTKYSRARVASLMSDHLKEVMDDLGASGASAA